MAWVIAYALAKKVQRTALTIPLTTNLDFGGYRGINVGTPVNPNDIFRKGDFAGHNVAEGVHGLGTGEYLAKTTRSDQLVSRDKMEYPTEDVSFAYLAIIGKLITKNLGTEYGGIFWETEVADKAIEGLNAAFAIGYFVRHIDSVNFYMQVKDAGQATDDHRLWKHVAGVDTLIGSEAVDLAIQNIHLFKVSAQGTTLSCYRDDMTVAKFSVTDATHASGHVGTFEVRGHVDGWAFPLWLILRAPSSPSPEPIAYFETPIIGAGTIDDPYRPQLPYEEYIDPVLGKRNLQALSHSSLIPTDPATGRPIHGTALVRIFGQPDRDPALRDIPACLDTLRGMAGVTELTRDDAIRRARALDDKLHLFDLVRVPTPVKDQIKEYIEWRRTVHKVEMPEELAKRYLESDKGW